MKTLKILILTMISVLFISGCATGKKIQPKGMDDFYTIRSQGNDIYFFEYNEEIEEGNANRTKRVFKNTLHGIAKFGESKGYRYMAIINNGFNNLSGYPINSWSAMDSYLDMEGKGHFRPAFRKTLASDRIVELRIKFFKNRIPGMFLWNLSSLNSSTY